MTGKSVYTEGTIESELFGAYLSGVERGVILKRGARPDHAAFLRAIRSQRRS